MRATEGVDGGRTNGRRVRRRVAAKAIVGGLTGLFGVVAAVMLLTPVSAAGATSVAFSAPYTAAKAVHLQDRTAQGCSAQLTVAQAAAFNLTTGTATGGASASAGPCATQDSQATYDGTAGLTGLGFKAGFTGTKTVTASWTVTWSGSASMNSAAANAGAQATVEAFLITHIVDTTTHSTYKGAAVKVVQKDLQSATSWTGGAVKASFTATISGVPIIAGHHYAIYAVIAFSAQAVVPQGAGAGSAATAAIDLASTGHGAVLGSVRVA